MRIFMKETKAKKCDYCDEFAAVKFLEEGLYSYACGWCSKNLETMKAQI